MKFKIISHSDYEMIVHITGVDVSFVNGLRRVLLAESESIAPETVYLFQNTGIIQDEVLTHRIGLIPFKIDASILEMRNSNEDLSDRNSFKYSLKTGRIKEEDLDPKTRTYSIYARDLKWIPMSNKQKEQYHDHPPRPVYEDILITKLGKGQEIDLEFFIEKGIGKTHAKWNPVCTASYKYEPNIEFKKQITKAADIEDLVELCPMNIFVKDSKKGVKTKNVFDCTTCRACIERFPDHIELSKLRDSYMFKLESIGSMPPDVLFMNAIQVLIKKCKTNIDILNEEQAC